jgi:hypothetical protein
MMKAKALLCTALLLSVAIAIAVALTLGAGKSVAAIPTPANLLSTVNFTDGITQQEAYTIARAYFTKHIGCGNFSGISEAKDAWQVEGQVGRGAKPIKGFFIHKKTGALISTIGPSYAHPRDMLTAK